jgi:hypothetical protein
VPRFNDGGVHYAWVDYDGQTKVMNVYLSTTPFKPGAPTLSAVIDVGATLGQTNEEVFLGFTAGTGGAINRHEILNWRFIPEPSTWTLMAMGVVGLAGGWIRRRRLARKED